jgi:DNA-binding LacI/PurR family transcriptional regulator
MQSTLHTHLPKYIQVAEQIRDEIKSGKLQPGDRLPGYSEAASKYATTKNTLEKAHRQLEQDGTIRRVNGIGIFVAEPTQRTLTGMIGVVHVPTEAQNPALRDSAHNSYQAHLMHGIRETMQQAGVEVLLLQAKPSLGWEKVDGILAHGDAAGIIEANGLNIPMVSMMHRVDGIPSVTTDDANGARQATEHLLALGHRRIGYMIDASVGNPLSQQRLTGYREALKNAGIKPLPQWVGELWNCGPMMQRGHASMQRWFEKGWDKLGCTALLVQNDRAAIGAMEALRQTGLEVPKDVSVVGFDSTEECDIVQPRLTSVHVPLDEIGAQAAQLLLKLIREVSSEKRDIILPVDLQVRESTEPPKKLKS